MRIGNARNARDRLLQDLQPFLLVDSDHHPGEVPAGLSKAGDESVFDRIGSYGKHDRDGAGGPPRCIGGWRSIRHDEVDLEPHQLSREGRELINSPRIAWLDLYVLPLDP